MLDWYTVNVVQPLFTAPPFCSAMESTVKLESIEVRDSPAKLARFRAAPAAFEARTTRCWKMDSKFFIESLNPLLTFCPLCLQSGYNDHSPLYCVSELELRYDALVACASLLQTPLRYVLVVSTV